MSTTPTLDDHRLDEIRTHLTVLAAAEVATTRSAPAHPVRRRIVVGTTAAALLAGGLVAATALVDSPGLPGPVRTSPAVAIEHVDGWTEIDIVDPGASPAEIEAALDAAGVTARVETLDLTPEANGDVVLGGRVRVRPNPGQPVFDPAMPVSFATFDPDAVVVAGFAGSAGDLGMVIVEFPAVDVDLNPTTGGVDIGAAVEAESEYRAAVEATGVRYPDPGGEGGFDVAVRDGAVGVEVVLWAIPA